MRMQKVTMMTKISLSGQKRPKKAHPPPLPVLDPSLFANFYLLTGCRGVFPIPRAGTNAHYKHADSPPQERPFRKRRVRMDGFPFSRRGSLRQFAVWQFTVWQFALRQVVARQFAGRCRVGLSSVSVDSGVCPSRLRLRTRCGGRPNQRSGTRGASSKNPKRGLFLRAAFRFHTGQAGRKTAPGLGDAALSAGLGGAGGVCLSWRMGSANYAN
jgi:hypothetical protein